VNKKLCPKRGVILLCCPDIKKAHCFNSGHLLKTNIIISVTK